MSADLRESLTAEVLQPLSGDAPTGRDLRLDVTPGSPYFRLRDARSNARAEERQADNDPGASDNGLRHWKTVQDIAVDVLTGMSKDIEVAAWLTESLVRSDGLAGLVTGARILGGLIETFWDMGLYPAVDEDGLEARLAPVAGLNGQGGSGTLLQPLRKIVLFERSDGTPVALWQYEQSEDADGIGEAARRDQRLAAGVTLLADLAIDARGIGNPLLAATGLSTAHAIEAWETLDRALNNAAGSEAPSTRRVAELLDKLLRITERYVETVASPGVVVLAPAIDQPAIDQPAIDGLALPHATNAAGPGREDLLADIARIASLFRVNEPNSPLGFTLDEAVRRARLAWPDLLKELVPDAGPRASFLSSLGIRPPAD